MTHGFSPSAPNNPLRCAGYRSALQPLREYVVNGKDYQESACTPTSSSTENAHRLKSDAAGSPNLHPLRIATSQPQKASSDSFAGAHFWKKKARSPILQGFGQVFNALGSILFCLSYDICCDVFKLLATFFPQFT